MNLCFVWFEYNQLLLIKNQKASPFANKSENPYLLEHASVRDPDESFLDFFLEMRNELDEEDSAGVSMADLDEMEMINEVIHDLKKRSYYF